MDEDQQVKKLSFLGWLRLAVCGSIVGAALAGITGFGGEMHEAAGAALGATATALLVKFWHIV